jgi:hypothetical protein
MNMDKVKKFHRSLGMYLPKQKHILLWIFYPRFKREVEAEAKNIKKEIEVKFRLDGWEKEVGLGQNDEKQLKKIYTALLKVLYKHYKTPKKVWREIEEWKNNHDILRFV